MMNSTVHSSENNTTSGSINWTDAVAPSPETPAAMLIWKIWPPCLLLVGGAGNIATVFVMRRTEGRNSPQRVMLISLAMADFCLLYTGELRLWLIHLVDVDVRDLHTVVCKLHSWMVYSAGSISAWILTFMTVQRMVAVMFPHQTRTMCTVRRTWSVIAAIVLAACSLHCHFLGGMGLTTVRLGQTPECVEVSAGYRHFQRRIFSWVDMCFSSLLPSACFFVCGAILSLALFKATASFSTMADRHTSSGARASQSGRKKTASKTTLLVLTLSCGFLVLTLPVNVFLIWASFVPKETLSTPKYFNMVMLTAAVTINLWYTNSAVNFFLYCLTGTKFRREFLRWFPCRTQARSTSGLETAANAYSSEASKQRDVTTVSDMTRF